MMVMMMMMIKVLFINIYLFIYLFINKILLKSVLKTNKIFNKVQNTKKYYVLNGFVPSMGKLLFGLFWIVLSYLLGNKFDTSWILTKEYQSMPLYARYFLPIFIFNLLTKS